VHLFFCIIATIIYLFINNSYIGEIKIYKYLSLALVLILNSPAWAYPWCRLKSSFLTDDRFTLLSTTPTDSDHNATSCQQRNQRRVTSPPRPDQNRNNGQADPANWHDGLPDTGQGQYLRLIRGLGDLVEWWRRTHISIWLAFDLSSAASTTARQNGTTRRDDERYDLVRDYTAVGNAETQFVE